MKKKTIVIACVAVALIAAGGFAAAKFVLPSVNGAQEVSGDIAYVTNVGEITGSAITFVTNRYSGIVESQEVVAIKADSDKTIKETFVEAGDTVKKGDKLFEYDIEEMQNKLSQDELDLEQTQAEIESYNSQIKSLEKEKSQISAINNANYDNQQLSLTNQIEALKLDLKKANYTVETKTKEIEKLKKSISNNVVKSTVDGIVRSVGGDASGDELNSTTSGYINITSDADYRIKALISEENISTFYEDAPVLVRSRVDDRTWTGKISSIDTSASDSSANMNENETTTKYPIYVELDSTDGLLVGQHVTVELDVGQTNPVEGLWLDSLYICDAETAPYVWADNNGKLVKKTVELGDYDEDMMKYEILSGITEEDYIAFPEETLTEGKTTAPVTDETFAQDSFGEENQIDGGEDKAAVEDEVITEN